MRFDMLSFLGVIVAFVALLGGNFLEGGSWQQLLNGPAALIVFGGTLGAAILQTPITSFKRAVKLLAWIIVPPVVDHEKTIKKISNWAKISRKNGLLGLEDQINVEKDPYIIKALKLLIDEGSPQTLRRVLEADLILSEQRDQDAVKFYASMGGYAPTIGIIGAVMGLIYVMRNLADPAELGAGIAVAFISTIYGVAVANLLLLPIANKLTIYINDRSHLKELIIEGSIYVADGENPRSIELKLDGYIS
ncbi:MAG: chemotaxis protein MotA [Candidatus Endobugula sp.]|jgi:chemotaxis protein MotA